MQQACSWVPHPELLRLITGEEGLKCEDDAFYAVGIYSQMGWPREWGHGQTRGNAHFHFVHKTQAGTWAVDGPNDDFGGLFDPERTEQKIARAALAITTHSDLIVPGGLVPLDALLREQDLDRASVEHAVRTSGGRFRMIDYKGRSAVQRTTV